jgi:hypothetical protein
MALRGKPFVFGGIDKLTNQAYIEAPMKESEREEAGQWLELLMPLYERSEAAIREIAGLDNESTAQDWDKAFSNVNCSTLLSTMEPLEKLPKPKYKELRKLKSDYKNLVKDCIGAGNMYLKSYYAGSIKRMTLATMVLMTGFARTRLEDFLKRLQKVRQEIEAI